MRYTYDMRIIIFGASGKVGRLVVELALNSGYEVTAFVHHNNPFKIASNLQVVYGDISNPVTVAEALEDNEAVISTLGSWGTSTKDIVSRGMQTIIPLMKAQNIHRIITLTGSGALWSGDKLRLIDRINHILVKLISPKVLNDGQEHIHLLEKSNLDWTILRSPTMNNKRPRAYQLSNRIGSPFACIPRVVVAQAIIDQLDDTAHIHQAPVIK